MKYWTYQGWSRPKRCRIASMVSREICGFSTMVLRKSPGASCRSRNVSAEIPSRRGIVCSRRRTMNVRIRLGSCALRRFDEDPVDVPQQPVRDHDRLQVAELVLHRYLGVEGRQPDD